MHFWIFGFTAFFRGSKTRKSDIVAHLESKPTSFLLIFFYVITLKCYTWFSCLNWFLFWLARSLLSSTKLNLTHFKYEEWVFQLLWPCFLESRNGVGRCNRRAHCHSLTNLAKTTGFHEQKLSRKAWRGTVLTCPYVELDIQNNILAQRGFSLTFKVSIWIFTLKIS